MRQRLWTQFGAFVFLVWYVSFASMGYTQEKDIKSVVEQLREMEIDGDGQVQAGIGTLAIRSLSEFQNDTKRLFDDVNQEWLTGFIDPYVNNAKTLFDEDQPLCIYWSKSFQQVVVEGTFNLRDGKAGLKEPAETDLLKSPVYEYDNRISLFQLKYANVDGDKLILADQIKALSAFSNAALIEPKLDQGSRALLNQSGFSGFATQNWKPLANVPWEIESLTKHEKAFVSKLKTKFDRPVLVMVGLKYHDQVLETRFRTQLDRKIRLDDLFQTRLSKADHVPDLGLCKENLLIAASMRMDFCKDSALLRALPQYALDASVHQYKIEWLGGATFNLLTQIIGDSWMDLKVARGAVYQSQAANAKFAFIGVVDSRNPAVVMKELRRISTLVKPLDENVLTEEQLNELHRLIEQLESTDPNLVARAETRLSLAGPRALQQLELMLELANPAVEESLNRVIKRIKTEKRHAAKSLMVMDPSFWSRLRPGLKLVEDTGTIEDCPSHSIEITADPEKTPEQVQQANRMMLELFGEEWAKIRLVQIENHFVFMLGSDDELLAKIVKQVKTGQGQLAELVPRLGDPNQYHVNQHGAMQVYSYLRPLGENLGYKLSNREASDEPRLSFASIEIEDHSLQVQTLVPTESIRSYTGFLFGGGF